MTMIGTDGKHRCFGGQAGKEFYGDYHDREWGVPVHDDRLLFENLILEGAQAGLSWETVLRKRDGYRRAFHGFDILRCAAMGDDELEALRDDAGIIRNRLKIYSVRKNALVFLQMQREFGSFDAWLWDHLDGPPASQPARAFLRYGKHVADQRCNLQKTEKTRHELCRQHHHLRLYAGNRNGRRPSRRMLESLTGLIISRARASTAASL